MDSKSATQDYLPVGSMVADRYCVESIAGKGGMGVVYKAQHVHISRTVALKMLLRDVATNPLEFKRFKQEAEAASQLRHPNIIAIYDFGPVGEDQFYLAMDYLDGRTLYHSIKKDGPLSLSRFQTVFTQACDALEHAHNNKVVHRDIKPGNFVLVDRNGEKDFLVIVDFGLVKLMTPGEDQGLTTAGAVLGSPLYMSPEQCRGLPLDPRTDIYSLGCVMYEALVGQVPLFGPTIIDTISKHLNEDPLPFKEVNPGIYVPPALEAVIMKALSKERDDRQQSMQELGRDLTKALSGAPNPTRTSYASLIKPSKQNGITPPVAQQRSQPNQQLQTSPPSYTSLTAQEIAAQALNSQALSFSSQRSKTNYRLLGGLLSLGIGGIMAVVIVGSLVVATNEMSHKARSRVARERAAGIPPRRSVNALDTVSNTVMSNGSGTTVSDGALDRDRALSRQQVVERDGNSAYDACQWSAAFACFKESVPLRVQLVGADDPTLVPYLGKLAVCAYHVHDPNAAEYLSRFQEAGSKHPDVILGEYLLLVQLCDPIIETGDRDSISSFSDLLGTAAQQATDSMVAVQLNMQRARLLNKIGKTAEAKELLRKSVDDSMSSPEINEKAKEMLNDLMRQQGEN